MKIITTVHVPDYTLYSKTKVSKGIRLLDGTNNSNPYTNNVQYQTKIFQYKLDNHNAR